MAIDLQIENISKSFGDLVLLNDISFTIEERQRIGLIACNGKGKSTLLKVIAGEEPHEGGKITMRNDIRVGYLEQEPDFDGELTVIEACLRRNSEKADIIARYEAAIEAGDHSNLQHLMEEMDRLQAWDYENRAKQVLTKLKIKNVNQPIKELSGGQKKRVALAAVLIEEPELMILDEPTAVLTPQETEKLFDVLRVMKEDGKAIIIITHKLNEVMEISDRVAVLRKGEYIGTVNTAETNETALTEMMVGKKVSLNIDRKEPVGGEDRLVVENLSLMNRDGVKALENISFTAKSGEILGIAGIAGSGQRELLEAIAGLAHVGEGSVFYNNPKTGETENLKDKTPVQIREMGVRLSFVPEDRLGMGLVGNMDIVDNVMLRSYKKGKSVFLERKAPKDLAEKIIEQLEVATPDANTPVRKLSGGNVQKVLVGREIASSPTVLMVAYPVRGLDINSSYTIYNLLNDQKEKGVAVIYVGEDLDVLLELCDRILVLCGGKVSGIIDARTSTKEEVGLLMTKLGGGEK